jgi:hypothetical protein
VANDEEVRRRAEAIRSIYRTKAIDLSDDQATTIARHQGKRLGASAILCAVVIIALVAFLIIRFLL